MIFLKGLLTNRIFIIGILVLVVLGFVYKKYTDLIDEIGDLNKVITVRDNTILEKDKTIKSRDDSIVICNLTSNSLRHELSVLIDKTKVQQTAISNLEIDSKGLKDKIEVLKNTKPSIKYIKSSNGKCEDIKDNLKKIKEIKYENL